MKFVLVCLANYADPRGICYPSQAQLCDDTGQDRKTVQLNVSRLTKAGLLRDTGHRIGATKGVVVYKIIGIPESSTRHYVYRTFEPSTGEFYIGKRSFDGDPRLDEYRGSGRWVLEKLGAGATLVKEIVSEHMTSEEAFAAEYALQRKVENDPLCRNDGTPLKHRQRGEEYYRRAAEAREKRDGSNLDRENRDSLDVPLFPESDPKNGRKPPQKRGTEPSLTVTEPKTGAAARRSRLPDDFKISDRVREWAKGKGYPLDLMPAHLEKFLRTVKANGSKYVDWDEALMNCIADDWGEIRRKAFGFTGPGAAPKVRICAYCDKPSTGNVHGIEHCKDHSLDAGDEKPRPDRTPSGAMA